MKLIGLYKTNEAAQKAKSLMRERGIPDERTSLLAPDDTRGPHLAAFAHHAASSFAWLGAAIGAAVGALCFGAVATGELTLFTGDVLTAGRGVTALFGCAVGLPLGAMIGAVIGWRHPTLKADFFEADATRGGSALGVVTHSEKEAEAARYAFRSTGALQVRAGGAHVPAPVTVGASRTDGAPKRSA